jgi:hypothetical protein
MSTLDNFPKEQWYTPGACGYWSVKDLIAHLSSFELVLVDVMNNFLDTSPSPYLDKFIQDRIGFNDFEVEHRKELAMEIVLREYQVAYERVMSAASEIHSGIWSQKGSLPWYGGEYDLEDFIVYTYYGHKREHCGQIAVFSDQFK